MRFLTRLAEQIQKTPIWAIFLNEEACPLVRELLEPFIISLLILRSILVGLP